MRVPSVNKPESLRLQLDSSADPAIFVTGRNGMHGNLAAIRPEVARGQFDALACCRAP
jgi:hypothetical protein